MVENPQIHVNVVFGCPQSCYSRIPNHDMMNEMISSMADDDPLPHYCSLIFSQMKSSFGKLSSRDDLNLKKIDTIAPR